MVGQPSQLEIAVNDVRSELQFFRIALQTFFINVAGRSEAPLDTLREMKQDVFQLIAKVPVSPQTAQADQRTKAMLEGHGEAFFADLLANAERMLASRDDSKAAH
jgi:hypothetical protein